VIPADHAAHTIVEKASSATNNAPNMFGHARYRGCNQLPPLTIFVSFSRESN
jgi:hypothetical protein